MLSRIKNMDLSKLQGQDEHLPPEQILLRWFNWHLQNAGHNRTVANFSNDIMDSENYIVLLGQLVPDKIRQVLKSVRYVRTYTLGLFHCGNILQCEFLHNGTINLNLPHKPTSEAWYNEESYHPNTVNPQI